MLSPVPVGTVTNGSTQTTKGYIILEVYNAYGLEYPGLESWQGLSRFQNLKTVCEVRPASSKILKFWIVVQFRTFAPWKHCNQFDLFKWFIVLFPDF
jgi:hypothetical protein